MSAKAPKKGKETGKASPSPAVVEPSPKPKTLGIFKKKFSVESKDQDTQDIIDESPMELEDVEEIADDDLEPYFPEVEEEEHVIDPQSYKRHLTSRVIVVVAVLNVILGSVYLAWRVLRGMTMDRNWTHWKTIGADFVPEDGEKGWDFAREMETNWFSWLLMFGEIFLMIAVWHSHISRFFPIKRTICTMNDLIEKDYELSRRTQVTIVLPTRGKPLTLLRDVIFNIMSLHLWPGKLDVRRNLRLVVSDEDRRPEVVTLVALTYQFATLFCNNRKLKAQLKREGRQGVTIAKFFDYYLQCTAGFGRSHDEAYTEVFEIGDMIYKMCRENCIPQEYDGIELPQGKRVEPSVSTDIAKMPRLREDFDEIRNILTIVYFSRAEPNTPANCPGAGELNAVLFPEDPADADILGGARFLVINDPRFALETEYLQRTMPYFFQVKREKGSKEVKYVIREDIAFVTVPPRFPATRDRDPLGYRNHIRYDIESVGRDGMGGVIAEDHGTIYRVDVLTKGKDAQGKVVVLENKKNTTVGNGLGFSERTIKEHLTTSIELFSRGYRSVFVNEYKEILTTCIEDENRELDDKVQSIFNHYRAALDILAADPIGLAKAKYANGWQRSFIMEDLVSLFILGMAMQIIILTIILYCIMARPPFFIHSIEFLFFFMPYYISAALPTAISMNWKRIKPDPTFRSVQVAFTLSYVAVYAALSCMAGEISRVFCSRKGRRKVVVTQCPTWPVYATVVVLVACMIVSTIHWIRNRYSHPGLWMTTVVVVTVALYTMWPLARRGMLIKGFTSFYIRYAMLGAMVVIVGLWQGSAPR